MDSIIFYQPPSTVPGSKPKKTPQVKSFAMLNDDSADLEIVDLTGIPADSYDHDVEFRSLDDILPPSPERISEMTDDDGIGKPETVATEEDELPSLEELLDACLKRSRDVKAGYHEVEDPDTVATSKPGDSQERSQPFAISSINKPGDSPEQPIVLESGGEDDLESDDNESNGDPEKPESDTELSELEPLAQVGGQSVKEKDVTCAETFIEPARPVAPLPLKASATIPRSMTGLERSEVTASLEDSPEADISQSDPSRSSSLPNSTDALHPTNTTARKRTREDTGDDREESFRGLPRKQQRRSSNAPETDIWGNARKGTPACDRDRVLAAPTNPKRKGLLRRNISGLQRGLHTSPDEPAVDIQARRPHASTALVSGQEGWEIGAVLGRRERKGKNGKYRTQVLVRWKCTWVDECDVDAPELLREFEANRAR